MLLIFVKFCVREINVDGKSKRLAVILNFSISHGGVAMKLRWDGSFFHFTQNVSSEIY